MASIRAPFGSRPSTPSEKLSPSRPWTPNPHASPWTPNPPRNRWPLFLVTRKRMFLVAILALIWFLSYNLLSPISYNRSQRPNFLTSLVKQNTTSLPNAAFQPPETLPYRYPDTTDTFANYKYRNACNISSLDLHAPFAPLCPDRKSLIQAMSGGGRIGFDAPYMPRGCDMRWFTTEEICEILSRFEKVIIVGDSMMRHVIGSINVLIRKDLGYGAVTDWNFSPEERRDCFCNYQFNVKACSIQGIFRTADVLKNDPDSLACSVGGQDGGRGSNTVDVMIEQMIRFPIAPEEIDRLKGLLPATKPKRPYAFVFGHGLWNDLDLQATVDWLDLILETVVEKAGWLGGGASHREKDKGDGPREENGGKRDRKFRREEGFFPRLILTPNAAGKEKPDEWIVSQGNKALMVFEESVKVEAGRRGVEHLGTWNMSVQSNKFDGVHVDLKGNLIKAMMVLNWLNMVEVEKF